MPENPPNGESQNGKAKSRKAQLVAQVARLVRKEGLDYDGWRYVAKKGEEDLRASTGEERSPAAPCPDHRRVPAVLSDRRSCRGCPARFDAAGCFSTRRCVFLNSATSESPMLISKPARSGSTWAREARIATSCSASASPRHCERTSLPIRTTAGSSRRKGTASSQHDESSRSSRSTPKRLGSRRPRTRSDTKRSLG